MGAQLSRPRKLPTDNPVEQQSAQGISTKDAAAKNPQVEGETSQGASANPQDEFEAHVQLVMSCMNKIPSNADATHDPDAFVSQILHSLTDVQGSSRFLLDKLDEMYTEGMPPERKTRCKEISKGFWNLQVETLSFTPKVRMAVQKKVVVARLLKSIHDQLQAVKVGDETSIPDSLHRMRDAAMQKLADLTEGPFAQDRLKISDRLLKQQKRVIEEISEEIAILEELKASKVRSQEDQQRWSNVFKVLAVLGLFCAVCGIGFACNAWWVAAAAKSKAAAEAAAASAEAANALTQLASANGALAQAQGFWAGFTGAHQAAAANVSLAQASALSCQSIAAAAEAAAVQAGTKAVTMAAVTMAAGAVSTGFGVGSYHAKCAAEEADDKINAWSATVVQMESLQARYERLKTSLQDADASVILVSNFLGTTFQELNFLEENLQFWHLMKHKQLGISIDTFEKRMQDLLQQTDKLETISRNGIAAAFSAPHKVCLACPPVQTKLVVTMPLLEGVIHAANEQDAYDEPEAIAAGSLGPVQAGGSVQMHLDGQIHPAAEISFEVGTQQTSSSWGCSLVQGMHCFVGRVAGLSTTFLMADRSTCAVECLREDDLLLGPDGAVKLLSIREQPIQPRVVFALVTAEFAITATSDHRVVVQTPNGFQPMELGRLTSGVMRASNGSLLSFTVTQRPVTSALFELTFEEDKSVFVRTMQSSEVFGEVRGALSVPYDPAVFTMFRFKGPVCETIRNNGIRQWCVSSGLDAEALELKFWESCPYAVWVPSTKADSFFDQVHTKMPESTGGRGRSKVYRVRDWQFERMPASPAVTP